MTTSPASSSEPGSSSFDLLEEGVRRWIWEKGWTDLRDTQEEAIPAILDASEDVIVAAATAGGKTEAAFLPICSRLAVEPGSSVRALYVSPLKALINDQFRRMEDLCDDLEIPVHRWHGDVSSSKKERVVRDPGGVLLITPESLEALFVVHGTNLKEVFAELAYVVIDEMHAFIGNERGRQLQSLLDRLELLLRRRLCRVGLSATLGDMEMAADFLRPGRARPVRTIVSAEGGQELKLQLRGYVDREGGDVLDLAHDLFDTLRGADNLVFANSRTMVEVLADQLRRTCEAQRVPNEFWPHHGSLSKELRESVEEALKDRTRPLTAVCTNTLEMGIDIGTVTSIAQVGTPPSIAGLRQRLGRSGRRGEPSILRIYIREPEVTEKTPPEFTLRASLVQAVACVRLLLDRWCEPPSDGALHLSTLVQQVLSLIAQFNGVKAKEAWRALCESGPFEGVDQAMFAELLRGLAADDIVMQMDDDTLILGLAGEKVVGHYSFFAAFSAPDEYRLVSDQKTLGTIPVHQAVTAGAQLVFAGRRWRVTGVSEEKKTMYVTPGAGGQPPLFLGDAPPVHGRVRREMRVVYEDAETPGFLDAGARALLAEGRAAFADLGLLTSPLVEHGSSTLLFPWAGDRVMDTMALMLRAAGMEVVSTGVALRVRGVEPDALLEEIRSLVDAPPPDPVTLAGEVLNKERERYDRHLPDALLDAGYASQHLDVPGAVEGFRRVVEGAS